MALVKGQKIELSDIPDFKFLEPIKSQYHVPGDCEVGSIVKLDGIECVCVATDVAIQGSDLRRIAVDRNHDLGYYQKYVGMTQNNVAINKIDYWRWGGYGTALGNTSQEVGYGLQNTINCLANTANYGKGTFTGSSGEGYPWLWQGVNDFRSSHSDNWFVPSLNELLNYVCNYKNSLNFGTVTKDDIFWSSSETSGNNSYFVLFGANMAGNDYKYNYHAVRLCRAF